MNRVNHNYVAAQARFGLQRADPSEEQRHRIRKHLCPGRVIKCVLIIRVKWRVSERICRERFQLGDTGMAVIRFHPDVHNLA